MEPTLEFTKIVNTKGTESFWAGKRAYITEIRLLIKHDKWHTSLIKFYCNRNQLVAIDKLSAKTLNARYCEFTEWRDDEGPISSVEICDGSITVQIYGVNQSNIYTVTLTEKNIKELKAFRKKEQKIYDESLEEFLEQERELKRGW